MERHGLRRTRIALGSLMLAGLAGCGGAATIAPPVLPAAEIRDAAPAPQARPARRVSSGITEAAFHRGLLWLRGARGTLTAVDPGRDAASTHLGAEHVIDIHRTLDDRLWVLSTTEHDVHLWERVDGGFRPVLEMAAPSSPLLAVADVKGRPVILARRAIFFVDPGGALRGTSLDEEVTPGLVPQISFAVTATGSAYAGTSSGEWGGALYRIRLSSGEVQRLSRIDRPELCEGPLNPKCDPVTSIIPDPDAPPCVLVGIGLRHFIDHGRLLRVCGRKVDVVWTGEQGAGRAHAGTRRGTGRAPFLGEPEPVSVEPEEPGLMGICQIDPAACPAIQDEPASSSSAVFGLSRTRSGYWMVAGSALFHAQGGRFRPIELPPLEKRAVVALGWTPGALVLVTGVNWAASVSGYTPLVAATSLEDPRGVDDIARYAPLQALAGGSPQGTCWMSKEEDAGRKDGTAPPELVLCFKEDRYFAKDARGWTSGLTRLRRAADRAWVAELPDGQRVRLRVGRDVLMASSDAWRSALRRAAGAELTSLEAEVAGLPAVEEVCGRALRCHTAALDARRKQAAPDEHEDEYEGVEREEARPAPPYSPPPRDLRGCEAWLSRAKCPEE